MKRETRKPPIMARKVKPSAAALGLKALREKYGITMPEAARAGGYSSVSAYQHYEDLYKKDLLPLGLVKKLAPLFASRGATLKTLYALAGIDDPSQMRDELSTKTTAPVKDSDTSLSQDDGSEVEMSKKASDLVEAFLLLDSETQDRVLLKIQGLAFRADRAARNFHKGQTG